MKRILPVRERSVPSCFLLLVTLFCVSNAVFAEEEDHFFEFGLGAGESLNGLGTGQLLLMPALNLKIRGTELLRLRVEGDMETIYDNGQGMTVGGIAPFLRVVMPSEGLRPFLEIGGGPNLADRNDLGGRRLGGRFCFSAMAGAGVELVTRERVISLSYRVRHLSNANLYVWNQGLNSQYIILSVGF